MYAGDADYGWDSVCVSVVYDNPQVFHVFSKNTTTNFGALGGLVNFQFPLLEKKSLGIYNIIGPGTKISKLETKTQKNNQHST